MIHIINMEIEILKSGIQYQSISSI